jgi:hypothetical protein
MTALAFIAFRIREHGIHAFTKHDRVIVLQDGQTVEIRTWADCREFLGYNL